MVDVAKAVVISVIFEFYFETNVRDQKNYNMIHYISQVNYISINEVSNYFLPSKVRKDGKEPQIYSSYENFVRDAKFYNRFPTILRLDTTINCFIETYGWQKA